MTKNGCGDFPGGPVISSLPSKARNVGKEAYMLLLLSLRHESEPCVPQRKIINKYTTEKHCIRQSIRIIKNLKVYLAKGPMKVLIG